MMGYSSLGKEAIEKKYGIKFKATATGWLYEWDAGGMLRKVVNPQQGKVRFGYDPLGRRQWKEVKNHRTCWLWDGNVPLHEWTEEKQEPEINLITWVFEDGGFVPCACIKDGESYSIITDYLGTPTQMYNQKGEKTWDADLDIYGRVRTFTGSSLSDCPFRYQGQYEDAETGLYYNRFRYYDAEVGSYISKDPIGLAGGNPTMYGYVKDVNSWLDELGLKCWKKAREDYWKKEAQDNPFIEGGPNRYSRANLDRMAEGKAPRMTIEVINRRTGLPEIKDVSMELHHTLLPQRGAGQIANESWNLSIATPWGHESMDPFRHTGYDLVRIISGTNSWMK